MLTANFDSVKAGLLRDIAAGNDLSPKGCIDAPILDLVQCINGHPDFCTTSSCSGRISSYINKGLSKGIQWLLVRHGTVDVNAVLSSLGPVGSPDITNSNTTTSTTNSNTAASNTTTTIVDAPEDLTVLKCEGALMHILCRDAASARRLHGLAMTCGFRESGISLSPKKVMLAIRSTAFSLEFPIASRGELIIGMRALTIGVHEANRRILANFARTDRLLAAIKDEFRWPLFKEIALQPSDMGDASKAQQYMLSRWGHVVARCGESDHRDVAILGGFGFADASMNRTDRKLGANKLALSKETSTRNGNMCAYTNQIVPIDAPASSALKCMHAAIASDAHFIVIHGGRNSPTDAIGTTTIIDRSTMQIVAQIEASAGAGAPSARWGHTLTSIGNGAFLLVGGRTPSGLASGAYILHRSDSVNIASTGPMSHDSWIWSAVAIADGNTDAETTAAVVGRVFHAACALNPDLSGLKHRLFPTTSTSSNNATVTSTGTSISTTSTAYDVERSNHAESERSTEPDEYSRVLIHGGIVNLDTSDTSGDFYAIEIRSNYSNGIPSFQAAINRILSKAEGFPTRFGHVLSNIGCKCVAIIGGATFATDKAYNFDVSVAADQGPTGTNNVVCDKQETKSSQIMVFDWSFDEFGEVHLKPRTTTVVPHQTITEAKSDAKPIYTCSIEAECRVHHHCVSFRDALGFNNDMLLLGGGMLCVGFSAHFCNPIMLRVTYGVGNSVDARLDSKHAALVDDQNDATATSVEAIAIISSEPSRVRVGETILAPKSGVKAVKTILEQHNLLDKSRRIAAFADDGAVVELVTVVSYGEEEVTQTSAFAAAGPLMAIPVLSAFVSDAKQETKPKAVMEVVEELSKCWPTSRGAVFIATQKTPGSKLDIVSSQRKAFDFLGTVCSKYGMDKTDLPRKFEIVGDVLMISEGALPESAGWSDAAVPGLWRDLAACFDLARVARHARIDSGPKRESRVQLLLPSMASTASTDTSSATTAVVRLPDRPGWVVVNENGIRFGFDILKVMFCSGNVTERMRMARVTAKGEVVVDLYSGVGYYTLPFLVYAGVQYLHAFEWNPNSVASLLVNLAAAKVSPDRCMVHYGNNIESVFGVRDESVRAETLKQSPPLFDMAGLVGTSPYTVRSSAAEPSGDWTDRLSGIADRVCLGLLPSSRGGWEGACHVLKATGGTLHVHYNVLEADIPQWVEKCAATFTELFISANKPMRVTIAHVEKVKSYSPKVLHIVVDLTCSPNDV